MKKIISSQIYYLLLIGFVALATTSCDTLVAPKKLPTLTTDTISTITQNTAICGGNITDDKGLEVTARGICWGLKPNPTIKDTITKDAAGTGKFKSQLTNLVPDTTYYVRAYATNTDGTAYGLQVTFKTSKAVYAVLTTTKATSISDLSATSGGNVSFNGGTNVIQRGVCWGTNTFPTILDNKTTDGLGNGNFTSSISGLTAGTTYYIRSYATNKTGTGYGNQDTIKTLTIPSVTTINISSITQSTAISGGNVISDGGSVITARGVVWSTSQNPTITLTSKTTDGNDTGSFTSSIIGLTVNTTYYIKAYATNRIGTAYGEQLSFDTNTSGTFTDPRDGSIYKWIRIGNQVWMAENLKATKYNDGTDIPNITLSNTWNSLLSGAYCWYNNDIKNYTYGALYNWFSVNTGKLAPIGWHVPTDSEWTILESYLLSNSISISNTSGFNALKGGWRDTNSSSFYDLGQYGYWWTSKENDYINSWIKVLQSSNGNLINFSHYKVSGVSVRCIKN